jgi:hypothetical protein
MAMYIVKGGLSMTMVRTQIYLDETQRRELQRLAGAQNKTMAQIIREAVEAYMAQETATADALWDIVGLGASGIRDGSVEHDRDIYGDD